MKANSRKFKHQAGFSRFLLDKNAPRINGADFDAPVFGFSGKPRLRLISVLVLCTMTAMLMRGIGGTAAYLSDREGAQNNEFNAGVLDFSLTTQVSTSSICVPPDRPLRKTISITNPGNPMHYRASTGNLTGAACDYVNLEARLNGELKYTGPAKNFTGALTLYSDPSDWTFDLSFATTTPPEFAGETCQFTFDFQGAQTRHDLAFPTGFSDFENSPTAIQAPYCQDFEVRSYGYWKTHPEVYLPLLPVSMGATTTAPDGSATGTDVVINTQTKVNQIFTATDSIMRNKLKKQLLAMKFNILNFHIDAYVPPGETRDLDAIVAAADDMLRQVIPPSNAEMEAMKNLLEGVNIAVFVRICSCEPPPPPDSCALRLTKTVDKTEAAPGEVLTYHLTLDNYGTKVCTGGGVRIHDYYPSSLEYISYASTRQPNYTTKSSGFFEWNFGSVYPDDPLIEIDFKLKVPASGGCNPIKCGSALVNQAKFWSNQTDWSAWVTAQSTVICPNEPAAGKVVINEFLPNPAGADNAQKPGGEWVELYNSGGSSVDVNGWKLYDNSDSHELLISAANTDSGATIVAPGGFLVVYRNGDADFALNNTGGDAVRLFDGPISGGAALIDSYAYTGNAPEGKSFARIPDGSANWVDPIPTPGAENSASGAEAAFGPALPEVGEDGYVEPAPPAVAAGNGSDNPAVISTTTPVESPAADLGPAATTTPSDGAALPPPADPPPAAPEKPVDLKLTDPPPATNPPEIILPDAPPAPETGSGG